jgi:hypothetical protein
MPLLVLASVLRQAERAAPGGWTRQSVHGSRRNALRASSELAARRREREEVEAFLRRTVGTSVPAQRRPGSARTS